MTNKEKISLGIAVAGAAAVWFAKRHFGIFGIGDLTAWNKRHLADYFERDMWGGMVVVNTGAVDDRGYYPVDFYTDKLRAYPNFTYLVSPKNIDYLKELCRLYHCKFTIEHGDADYPNVHRVSGIGKAPFKFREGDRVIVHSRKGDFEGVVENYDYNIMTWKPEYDINYDGTRTMISVPESAIELIERASDEEYQRLLRRNKLFYMMQ